MAPPPGTTGFLRSDGAGAARKPSGGPDRVASGSSPLVRGPSDEMPLLSGLGSHTDEDGQPRVAADTGQGRGRKMSGEADAPRGSAVNDIALALVNCIIVRPSRHHTVP